MTAKVDGGNKPTRNPHALTLMAGPKDDKDTVVAQAMLHPTVQAGVTALHYPVMSGDGELTLDALIVELRQQCDKVHGGDLHRAEAMLMAQAHTLDAIFGDCARRAARNMGEYLNAAETYLRLALKAQAQCRATLETLANIKNPPTVFARQANIAHGPQQVNNGMPVPGSRAGKTEDAQNELSRGGNELLPDARAPQATSRVDPPMEAMGEINRAEDRQR
jgi:hypothetical protein